MTEKIYISTKEASAITGLTITALLMRVYRRKIPGLLKRENGRLLFPLEEVERIKYGVSLVDDNVRCH